MTQALPDASLLMEGLVEQTLAGIYVIQDGVMTYANPACAQIFGYDSPDQFVGCVPLDRLVAPEDRAMVAERRKQRAAGEVDHMRYSFTGLRRDGSRVEVEVQGRRAELAGRAAVIGVVVDVSARRHAERAKADFLRVVGHELRTPLHQIKALGMLMRRDAGDDGLLARLDRLDAASTRLHRLIEAILGYSALERGTVEAAMGGFEPAALLERLRDRFADDARAKGLALAVSPAATCPERVVGDAAHLEDALARLMDNAIKFSVSGRITLLAAARDTDAGDLLLRLSVEDQGPGVPPELRDSLFERFNPGDASTTRQFDGIGLGLATCRQLAGLMDGEVAFEPVEGGGSRFSIEVPVLRWHHQPGD
ncbi:MAG: PAS domain S-box protein [Rhodocyclaceae bacterium]|nr:PAS domain S-box protein [Rhodocyclaceae bacterium]